MLKQWAPDVVSVLLTDACIGPVVWRVMATITVAKLLASVRIASTASEEATRAGLGIVVTQNGGEQLRTTAAMISPIYSQSLFAAFEKGRVQQLISAGIGPIGSQRGEDSNDQTGAQVKEYEDRALGLMDAVLTFCTELAETVDGVSVLLQARIFNRLLTLNHLLTPVSQVSNDHEHFYATEAAKQTQENHFMQCLCLLRVILNTNNSIEVVTGTLQFFKRYRNLIMSYLTTQNTSLSGMKILKSLLCVMSAAAVVKGSVDLNVSSGKLNSSKADGVGSPLKKSKSDPSLSSNSQISPEVLFDAVLGVDADVFTTEICTILFTIGKTDHIFF